jgi:hypothetical protein
MLLLSSICLDRMGFDYVLEGIEQMLNYPFQLSRRLFNRLLMGFSFGVLTAMSSSEVTAIADSSKQLNPMQGIQGQVVRLEGNRMPEVGTQRSPQSVSTLVWVFTGQIQSQGKRWPISEALNHPNWRATVVSDPSGKFKIGLPQGEYTLFAQDGDNLYLNLFTGDGTYKTAQVHEGQLTELTLMNTEQATF